MCVTAVCNLHKDDVANVRFNVAKTLGNMTELVSKKHVVNNVRPALEALSSDSDIDVSYFAKEALQSYLKV